MDYTELYAQKKMTAEQAAALVKSGDWVDYGWAVNTRWLWMLPSQSVCLNWRTSTSAAAS